MRQFLKFVGASLKMTYREKIALFWMFLFPLVLMLLLGTIFGHNSQTNVALGVVDRDNSNVTKAITAQLGKISAFKIQNGSESALKQKLMDAENLNNNNIDLNVNINEAMSVRA